MATSHVFELLDQATETSAGGGGADDSSLHGVIAVFGSERFLKQLAVEALLRLLGGEEASYSAGRFDGESAAWPDVSDELYTLSLFGGGGPRIAIVDRADSFVSANRERIAQMVEDPPRNATLILNVDKWASNTKLYKALDKTGFQVNCSPPKAGKSTDTKRITNWLVARAKQVHGFELPKAGASLLLQLTESEFGRMEQELCKLALYVDDKKKINVEQIPAIVGGENLDSLWSAMDKAIAGQPAEAVAVIHQLVQAGEHPLSLFGQISWSLRRFGRAGELVSRQQRQKQRVNLDSALKQAGFRSWGNEMEKAKSGLRQLGRDRVYALYDWILKSELAIKGSHSRGERAQWILEKLMFKMAQELGAQK